MTNRLQLATLAALLMCATACAPDSDAQIVLRRAFDATFAQPVDIQHAGDGTDRLFIVEQSGVISMVDGNSGNTKLTTLNIRSMVQSGGELGLLGLAFDPRFEENRYFYVNYTAPGPLRTVIARYTMDNDGRIADPNSALILLEFDQPFPNHNGGQIAFGPDSMLYIATGDGGSGGDPQNHGQRLNTVLGKILRIDVRNSTEAEPYVIPADNPFVATQGARGEIYAYGLRNPWRFSFDAETGTLWTGDVGQNAWEEIDTIVKGGNYGWKTMEGFHCYPANANCDRTGLELPVWEYGRDLGVSVTGGYVYRGSDIPELRGWYVYADFATGRIWRLRINEAGQAENHSLLASGTTISSFGVDGDGELYAASFGPSSDEGRIYRFEFTGAADDEATIPTTISRVTSEPNPFTASTLIRYTLEQAGDVTLVVRDVLGRVVATLVDGPQPRGDHSATLDASRLAAGTYYYTIERGDEAAVTGKVVLAR